MDYTCVKNTIQVHNVASLDLAQTLDCGQCFRWVQNDDGSFSGIAYGRQITVKKEGKDLFLYPVTEEEFHSLWKGYFDLELDYGVIRRRLSNIHPVLKEAAKYASGIRILRQEPFETLCTFIISQNNNIKRIKGIVSRLCEAFGKEIGEGNFAFPTAEAMAALTVEDLQPIRAGFRHRYLIDCAQKVHSGTVDLSVCYAAPYEEARAELMKIVGVGTKVADCVLLYGFHRVESFPLDVWMKKAMTVLFPELVPADFGPYAGIAQQYIFHYSRMHPGLFG